MKELSKEQEDLMLELGREKDYEGNISICEICGEKLDDTELCLDDLKVCTVCYDNAVEKGK